MWYLKIFEKILNKIFWNPGSDLNQKNLGPIESTFALLGILEHFDWCSTDFSSPERYGNLRKQLQQKAWSFPGILRVGK